MHIHTYSVIGNFHLNHNEDALIVAEIGETHRLVAVMDGCSMGKESHFASTLMKKLLQKIARELGYQAFFERVEPSLSFYLHESLRRLFQELSQLKNQLHLDQTELLSTLILGLVDREQRAAEILTSGDGLVVGNGQFYEYEQDDRPDYLGYHLAEDFPAWYAKQTQYLRLSNLSDLSIATDGVFSFRHFDNRDWSSFSETDILQYLLTDQQWRDHPQMLKKKVLHLKETYGLHPGDDLTLIRIFF